MSKMIIKDKITQLRKGYPTVSDKYNVAGGILKKGSAQVPFGELVKYTNVAGFYEPAAGATAVIDIAGVALATNVKLSGVWPDEGNAGTVLETEAFNLMLDGYVAIELDEAHTAAQALPGKKLAIILATGKLTTFDKVATGILEMPGYFFTGIVEGNLAEIEIRR